MIESNRDKAGYILTRISADQWSLSADYGTFNGDLAKVMHYAVKQIGFDFQELEMAINAMFKEDHNSAEFGIFKKFMYSFNKEENKNYH